MNGLDILIFLFVPFQTVEIVWTVELFAWVKWSEKQAKYDPSDLVYEINHWEDLF